MSLHRWISAPLTILLVFPLLVAPAGAEQAPAAFESDGRHLSLRLDPAGRGLSGELTQALPRGGRFPLLPGLEVEEARCDGAPLEVTREEEELWRVAPCPGRATLAWSGRLAESAGERGVRLAEAGSLLPAGTGWYPHLADGPGPVLIEIATPSPQRAVASGSLVEEHTRAEGRRARFHHPHTLGLEVAAGPWQLREQAVAGVRLRVLFPEPLDAAFGETYLTRAAEHLRAFQQRLGDFPFASFSIAASPAPVGLAFPGFTLLGERVIPLPFIPHTSLAHEIMHAWWGTGVRLDHRQGNWSEALTTYLADYHLDEQRGNGHATRTRWLTDLSALPAQQERALIDFHGGPDPAGRLIGYQHGAMVFHMLRQRIGDAAFDRALRALAETAMFHRVDW